MADLVQWLDSLASAAVAVYPTLSMSIAVINGSSVSTLHHSGSSVDKPTDSSLYDLGAITNTFTGTLLAHAVANHDVSLSTPIKEVLTELQGTEFPEDITLLSLATHTSGLPNNPPGFYDTPFEKYYGLTEEKMFELLKQVTDPPPTGQYAYSYSTAGTGLLAYTLERALGASWEELVHDVITGPDALDMPHTSCGAGSESDEENAVPGYIAEVDLAHEYFSAEELASWNLKKVGGFYEMPGWKWKGHPVRGALCLRSSLSDMIKYTRAAIRGAAEMPPECRSNYAHALKPPSQCLKQGPGIHAALGYAQQRQRIMGQRGGVNQDWAIVTEQMIKSIPFGDLRKEQSETPQTSKTPDQGASPMFQKISQMASWIWTRACQVFGTLFGGGIVDPKATLENSGEGIGLLWMTEDWSDTPFMPSGIKFHAGGTLKGSSVMLLNPDQEIGIVIMSNMAQGEYLTISPVQYGFASFNKLWCPAIGRPVSECRILSYQ